MKKFIIGLETTSSPTRKVYLSRSVVFFVSLIWLLIGYLERYNSKYFDIIVLQNWWLFWISTVSLLVIALTYTIYEQSKYKVELSIEDNRILIEHRYKRQLVKHIEIKKEEIKEISLETREFVSKNYASIETLLCINHLGTIDKYSVPSKVAKNIIELAKQFNFPINQDVYSEFKKGQILRQNQKWEKKISIIALTIFLILGITIPILLIWANGCNF